MYTEDRSSDPFVADQLRKEKFKGRQLTELQVGMVVGKLDGYDYDIENVRLSHKRLAKTPDIAQRDFLQRSFRFQWAYIRKLQDKEFDFLSPCMDWKTLWERVNYLFGCECIELPIAGADDRPYYAFFVGHKNKPPVGMLPNDIKSFDMEHNLWFDWKLKEIDSADLKKKSIEVSFKLEGDNLEEVLKIKDYHAYKSVTEAFSAWLSGLINK